MTHELAEVILACLKADDIDCGLYENYSGRGMMNRTTTGIQGDISLTQILSSVIAHAELLISPDEPESMFVGEELRQDSLGHDYVVY